MKAYPYMSHVYALGLTLHCILSIGVVAQISNIDYSLVINSVADTWSKAKLCCNTLTSDSGSCELKINHSDLWIYT